MKREHRYGLFLAVISILGFSYQSYAQMLRQWPDVINWQVSLIRNASGDLGCLGGHWLPDIFHYQGFLLIYSGEDGNSIEIRDDRYDLSKAQSITFDFGRGPSLTLPINYRKSPASSAAAIPFSVLSNIIDELSKEKDNFTVTTGKSSIGFPIVGAEYFAEEMRQCIATFHK